MTISAKDSALTHDSKYFAGVGLVLLAGGFMSTGGILVRLIDSATEWQIVLYRSITLALTLVIYLSIRRSGYVIAVFRTAGRTAVIAGSCLSAAFCCFIFALTHTTVANALFLLATAPFITAVLGRIILGERVKRSTWFAMTGAALGVSVMVAEGVAVGTVLGNMLGLGAAFGFSGFTIALRLGKTVDMTPAVCFAGGFAALVAGLMLVLSSQGLAISLYDGILCAILGVVQCGCGLIFYILGSRHVPAAELPMLALTEVVLGPIWVWVGIGEVPSFFTLFGGAIVLTAIIIQASYGTSKTATLTHSPL